MEAYSNVPFSIDNTFCICFSRCIPSKSLKAVSIEEGFNASKRDFNNSNQLTESLPLLISSLFVPRPSCPTIFVSVQRVTGATPRRFVARDVQAKRFVTAAAKPEPRASSHLLDRRRSHRNSLESGDKISIIRHPVRPR